MKKTICILLLFCGFVADSYAQFKYPLKVSENKRYFVDQNKKPFLYNADTGWFLFWKLTKEEAKEYLLIRKSQKFNVIQTMLMLPGEANHEGIRPFKNDNDFSTLNEAYFDHVEWVVKEADKLNLLIGIVPVWIGCCNSDWGGNNLPMQKNGKDKVKELGEYIGKRFARHSNIVWIIGGDNDPGVNKDELIALAEAIYKEAPHQMQTYHGSSTHSSTDIWENPDWLGFSMVYTYYRGFKKAWNHNQPDVYEVCYDEYKKDYGLPFILGESTYEGEHLPFGSALQARKQAWWAMLSGATGHAYGSPNWRCEKNWKEIMKYEGANTLGYMYEFLTNRNWYNLIPDIENNLVLKGATGFAENDYPVAAIDKGRQWAVVYYPSQKTLQLELGYLKKKIKKAQWYNPRNGVYTSIKEKLSDKHEFTSPDSLDWVLLLETK